MAVFLGIDVGGTVIKAGLYRASGEELAIAERDGAAIAAQPGFSERNMDALWDDVCAAIRQTLHAAGLEAGQVRGVSFRRTAKGCTPSTATANRSATASSSDNARRPRRLSCAAPGWTRRPPAQPAAAVAQPPGLLLRWLKQRQPAQYAAVDRILMAHDYLRFRLTGEAAAEVTNISGSNLFNQRSGAYDSALMAAFGIEEAQEKIAPTIGSAQLAGRVTPRRRRSAACERAPQCTAACSTWWARRSAPAWPTIARSARWRAPGRSPPA